MTSKSDDTSTIDTIRTYAQDIESSESKVKTLKEEITEVVEAVPEYNAVEELSAELLAAKEKLKVALMNNSRYNDLLEQLANEKDGLKEAKEILSDYLVEHFVRTHERQVELNPVNGDAREVIVKGKLGKKQKFQTNLFAGKK